MRIVKITAEFQSYQQSDGVSSIMKQPSFFNVQNHLTNHAFNLPNQLIRKKGGHFFGGDFTIVLDKTFQ